MLQGYFAVENRCAVNFDSLCLPITESEAMRRLWQIGFRQKSINIVDEAKKCVGVSRYRRGAAYYQAPFVVDCSTFVKWIYAKAGVWLPRHSIDQRDMGDPIEIPTPGDLVFFEGRKPYWKEDPLDCVGHVGMCVDADNVIHAANTKLGVTLASLVSFQNLRGFRRIITPETVTLEMPSNRMIEWSGEIRNILLQTLGE